MSTSGAALLFGLNYENTNIGTLAGCIHDVKNVTNWLATAQNCPSDKIRCFDDKEHPEKCTRKGILEELVLLGKKTWSEKLDWVWIHYSGHGTYERDVNGDEKDGQDEALVPTDAHDAGMIHDDSLFEIINAYNPKTRVILVVDACHSGTMCDLPIDWDPLTRTQRTTREAESSPVPILLLSGCRDDQTSADAYNYQEARYGGAFTDAFLTTLTLRPELTEDIFALVKEVRAILSLKRFSQIIQLSSSYNLNEADALALFPPPRGDEQEQEQEAIADSSTTLTPTEEAVIAVADELIDQKCCVVM